MLNLSNISSISIPIVAAILGIAMPIIVQTIAGIDTKYGSLRLLKRFKRERLYKQLWIGLTIALFALLIDHLVANDFLLTNLSYHIPSTDIKLPLTLYQNLTGGLVLISTVYLITVLFLVINLMIKYFDYQSLFEMVMSGVNRAREEHKEEVVQDLTELVKYCIYKNDDRTIKEYYEYMSDYVDRKNKMGGEVEYDQWLYDVVLNLNSFICVTNDIPFSMIKSNVLLELIIPNDDKVIISEKSYKYLWYALSFQLYHEKFDMVYRYWECAYSYSTTVLRPKRKIYADLSTLEVINQEEIDQRQKQIDKFKEFNYALGGYALYMGEYDLIADILNLDSGYSLGTYLLPSLFYDIVESYSTLYSFGSEVEIRFQIQYPFRSSRTSTNSLAWTKRFLVLSLFRLDRKNVYNQFVQNHWMYHLGDGLSENSGLRNIVEEMGRVLMLLDKDMISVVIRKCGLYDSETSVDEVTIKIKNKLDSFVSEIEDKIKVDKKTLELSEAKKVQFNDSTYNIISNSSYIYQNVLNECDEKDINENDINKDVIDVSFSHEFSKESFSDDTSKGIFNQDKVMAEGMVIDFMHEYSFKFYNQMKRYFKIDSDEMFKAIDKMIGEKRSKYVIINFGYYIDFYLNKGIHKINDLKKISEKEFTYKNNLKIHCLPSPGNELMDFTFVIIKEEDLPCYTNSEVPDVLKEKFKLEKINAEGNDLNIYTSILFDNFPEEKKHLENSEYCLATIYYSIQLYWKKKTDITILKSFSKLKDSGVATSINELPKL